jgi:phosphatidate phosphatase APP1
MPAARPGSSSTRRLRARQRFFAWLRRLAARLAGALGAARWALRRRWGRVGPLQILAYRGFGTPERVCFDGRVIERTGIGPSSPDDSRWRNLRRTVRHFRTREIPGARLRARLGRALTEACTDQEGYFHLALGLPEPPGPPHGWHSAEVELTGCPVRGWSPVRAGVEVLVPGPRAALGIVSDIDDTILQTHVTRRLKMIWLTLVENAHTRLPFEGTSELYRGLAAGASGLADNPIFYVSKSPWHLYDFLVEFMDRHGLPRGPLLLRELGLHDEAPLDFKASSLERILTTYARLPFVLIGDSSERDPDLYLETASQHPGRVKVIYIRDAGSGPLRRRQLAAMAGEACRLGSEMLLVAHAHEALAHARRLGLVAPGSAP